MKIVIAMDSFKGSLPAAEACRAVETGLTAAGLDAEFVLKPMADGGEGTADALRVACRGTWKTKSVMGPLPDMRVEAAYAWLPADEVAVIEMAAASGLTLLRPEQRNPLRTTTYGTGELLGDAVAQGARRIVLGIGGSATVDGGVGAASALGWSCLDEEGRPVPLGGGGLTSLARLVPPDAPFDCPVEVLCDVDNPLCGPEGAAAVYGPQKGATPEMVEALDKGLERFAALAKQELGKDVREVPGAGAAGGLGAGAMAFLGAKLVSGVDAVMRAGGLAKAAKGARWVITGEGRFDSQSLRGKVVSGVLRTAQEAGAEVAVLAGQVALTPMEYQAQGIHVALGSGRESASLEEQMASAAEDLSAAAARLAREHLGG